MKKAKLLSLGLAAVIAFSPVGVGAQEAVGAPVGKVFGQGGAWVVWSIFGCSSGIILAAMVANWRNNRQLSGTEAATCGALYWFSPTKPNSSFDSLIAGSRIKF
jgi:hypothetical protein